VNVVALDVGDKTIGVAATDELGITAQGLGTIWRKGDKHDFPALSKMVEDRGVERFVVGWPLNMDGSEGPRAEKTRRFARRLRDALGKPVLLWDERLSTFEADQVLAEGRVRPENRKEVIDMLAAQFILRSWLDAGAPVAGEEP
jgi:putative holliday junction resolvase